MAAGILQEYNIGNSMEIAARGLVVLFPEPLNQKAEAVLISNGITMDGYMSAQITPEDFGEDTLVLTLEEQLRQKLLELFADSDPEAVRVLTEYVGDELEIINPYGGTLQEYGLCYETLNRSLKKLVNLLNNKGE
ncbi:MAG: phosphotyrosine protein phosphatase [Lachnospiraceae bacterium]|nr:phosphotyrosine protein phosphatase [Lachnospiraceae bacterium]